MRLAARRFSLKFDVLVVGGGPAGLSCAIRLKQLKKDLQVCVLEKGDEIGHHILSGNVFEPRALDELLPKWRDDSSCPIKTRVREDSFYFLTNKYQIKVPHFFMPPQLDNSKNYVISLGNLCRWMSEKAENLGVDVLTGFPGAKLIERDGKIQGVQTSERGIHKDGTKKPSYEEGVEIIADYTVLAEGARGSLSLEAIKRFNLKNGPQQYGIGLKEIWEVPEEVHEEGSVTHTVGYPFDFSTYGGGFIYHLENRLVHVGLVLGLDYSNPFLNPYQELQRLKRHPKIRALLEKGRCISYGARVLNEGGFQAIPRLSFPGGCLVGCSAGFLNLVKIKGTHTAMKSGILAAEKIAEGRLEDYPEAVEKSWIHDELWRVRNCKPSFKFGFIPGMCYTFLSQLIRGTEPWTFSTKKLDWEFTKKFHEVKRIKYEKPDGKLTFDLLENLQRTGVQHEEDQPSHLKVKTREKHVPLNVSLQQYAAPEIRFCPAGVYEFIPTEAGDPAAALDSDGNLRKLQINFQNCIHCKTCSIKTPHEYINWTVPESGGPAYSGM